MQNGFPPRTLRRLALPLVAGVVAVSALLVPATRLYADEVKTAPSEFQPTWKSLAKHQAAPEWFRDAKFGIYFH
jgi:alpha-L-fucosidase